MNDFISTIWTWILSHSTTVTLGSYYVMSAFVGSLEMPNDQSGGLYRFFFRFVNLLAANFSRSQASTTRVGYLAPKTDAVPGPTVPPTPPSVNP